MKRAHRTGFGAEFLHDGRVEFRLWAPAAERVTLRLEDGDAEAMLPMRREEAGWFALATGCAGAGTRYVFQIGGEGLRLPDPASRFQPDGVHGASEVIDPESFHWHDTAWRGRPWHETVLYELHVGAFSREGGYAAVVDRLPALARLGITAIELMPVAQAPGRRDWGYDGVQPYAPSANYGRPEDLKRLVEEAHGHGLMVFMDVVYNHFGPEGNYLHRYAPAFFTERYRTPWGAAIDFEGAASRTVRDFVIQNALYWLQEYHLDGLRLDAVHAVHDRTRPDVLEELAAAVRKAITAARHVHLVLENDANQARYLAPRRGARAHYDAQWNDDAHHAYHVLLTGEHTGYYADFAQAPAAQLGRTLTQGFAFQGEVSADRQAPRGEASDDLPLTRFVTFLQNHDQIGNRALGERITALAGADAVRAASAVLLLAPSPPLLFMGEEWGASTPFLFFCDFEPELARRVSEGRRKAFSGLPEFSDPRGRAQIPDPNREQTFLRSTLRWDERARPAHRAWLDHYARLLELRHSTIVPRIARLAGGCGRYETFQQTGLLAHWRLDDGSRLTLIGNLGVRPLAGASALAQHLRGETLYASHPELRREAAAGALGAWSVLWLLET